MINGLSPNTFKDCTYSSSLMESTWDLAIRKQDPHPQMIKIITIIVNVTLSTTMFILEEASLSFLGLGVPLEVPTWGNILNAAQDMFTLQNNWWMWLPTGIVVSLFVMSINFMGDGIRDTTDPTQQG